MTAFAEFCIGNRRQIRLRLAYGNPLEAKILPKYCNFMLSRAGLELVAVTQSSYGLPN